MASKDPHQGGDLFGMAADGTSIPNDAGLMNTIPSKPRPGETECRFNANGNPLADAASNPTDISRGVRDMAATGEVETGTGHVRLSFDRYGVDSANYCAISSDQLPAQVESKRLHYGANDPSSKGHDRTDKHSKQKGSDLERYANEGPGVDLQPSEDNTARSDNAPDEEVGRIVDSRERKHV